MSKVRLTAKEAAERLNVSYVIAAGLLSHLEDVGKATVVEKRFHPTGKGKPTRIFEVDQEVSLNFGTVDSPATTAPVAEGEVATVEAPVATLDDVAAAVQRLKDAA